jgi:hypothetical protein
MNPDLGELLREGIERATAGERLHPGLAGRARQRHHRRTLTVRAMAVTGTAAVAAAAVFAATAAGSSPQQGGGLPAQATAYVMSHTEQALAAAERGNLVERVTATPPRIIPWGEVLVVHTPSGKLRRINSLRMVRATSWSYRGRTRTLGFGPGGRVAIDVGPSTAARPRGPQAPPRTIAVDPNARRWFHPFRMLTSVPPGPLTCGNQGADWAAAEGGGQTPAEQTALISKALACHMFRLAGRQHVDGVDAVRLVATPRLLREIHRGKGVKDGRFWEAGVVGPGVTLWVNSKTFLPVRLTLSPGERADFGWLKPTAANLATLIVKIPAGLREVRLPAGATLWWEAHFPRTP